MKEKRLGKSKRQPGQINRAGMCALRHGSKASGTHITSESRIKEAESGFSAVVRNPRLGFDVVIPIQR
jgi:hypothetical protein